MTYYDPPYERGLVAALGDPLFTVILSSVALILVVLLMLILFWRETEVEKLEARRRGRTLVDELALLNEVASVDSKQATEYLRALREKYDAERAATEARSRLDRARAAGIEAEQERDDALKRRHEQDD